MSATRDVVHDHFTRGLGRGARVTRDPGEVAVYSFATGPIVGLSSFATVGLSERVLLLRRRGVRSVWSSSWAANPGPPPSSARACCALPSGSRRAVPLLRGDIMTLETPIFASSQVTTVYAAPPLQWPPAVHGSRELDPPLVVVALLPLVGPEGDYVWSHGWKAFEAKLEALDRDTNLWDFQRAPVVDHP